jgi:YggT family protein
MLPSTAAAHLKKPAFFCDLNGGAEGDRTPDLDIANVALSQLSYCPAPGGDYVGRPGRLSRLAPTVPGLHGPPGRLYLPPGGARGMAGSMGGFLVPVIEAVIYLLELYKWVIIIAAVVSLLISFRVINTYNRAVSMIAEFLYRASEPALRPVRRILPNLGGIDISPIIVIVIIVILESWLAHAIGYVYSL